MPELNYKGSTIPYEIVRSTRRTLCIEVAGGKVTLRAPMRVSQRRIDSMIHDKSEWIYRHFALMPRTPSPHQYVAGETFPFLGKEYRLRVETNGHHPHVRLEGDEMVVFPKTGNSGFEGEGMPARDILMKWYADQACKVLLQRVSELAVATGFKPSRARVRKSRTSRWGSCSVEASINLNWRLVMAPPWVADYVIIHELCHIKAPNHSKKFWDLVASFLPDYRDRRKWLQENATRLEV